MFTRHWLLFLVVIGAGCATGPTPPQTFPATGVVKFTNGQPFPGGIISFTSTDDPRLGMDAAIADDGTFTLGMVFDNRRIEGAQPGTYDVLVSSRFVAGKGVLMYSLPAGAVIKSEASSLVITVDASKAKQ